MKMWWDSIIDLDVLLHEQLIYCDLITTVAVHEIRSLTHSLYVWPFPRILESTVWECDPQYAIHEEEAR